MYTSNAAGADWLFLYDKQFDWCWLIEPNSSWKNLFSYSEPSHNEDPINLFGTKGKKSLKMIGKM